MNTPLEMVCAEAVELLNKQAVEALASHLIADYAGSPVEEGQERAYAHYLIFSYAPFIPKLNNPDI